MHDNPYFDDEVKNFFIRAIPRSDMTKEELVIHFEDMIRQSHTITIKLGGWLDGFKNEYLKKHTPNDLLNKDVILPQYDLKLTVKQLLQVYDLEAYDSKVYRWLREEEVPKVNKSGNHMYYRVDFERMLNNKGCKFDKKRVEKLIYKIAIEPFKSANK